MTLRKIIEGIGYLPRFVSGNMDTDIAAVELAELGQTFAEPKVLYVVDENSAQSFSQCKGASLFLVACDDAVSSKDIDFKNQTVIMCEQIKSTEQAIKEISKILLEERRFLRDAHRLTELLLSQKSIQQILDTAYEILKNPIFVLDSSFKLVAYKKNHTEDVDDVIWRDLEKYGYFTYENIRLSKLDKRYSKITQSQVPIYVIVKSRSKRLDVNELGCNVLNLPDGHLNNSRIITTIANTAMRFGTITILEYEAPFENYHFKIAQLLNDIILCHIQGNQDLYRKSTFPHEHLLGNLLQGNIQNSHTLNDQLKILNWNLKDNLFVFSVGVAQSPMDLLVLMPSITTLVPDSKAIVHDNYIVFLISHNKNNAITNNQLTQIRKYLKENNLYGGISVPFNNLLDMGKYYRQSVKAIELGSTYMPNRIVFSYMDCMMINLVDAAGSAPDANIRELCHPSLFKLMEHDRLKNTEYTLTLYEFLNNTYNFVKTSEVLCIHRNSLAYRIKKIEEILIVDLQDAQTAQHLYASFLILTVAKERTLLREFGINI